MKNKFLTGLATLGVAVLFLSSCEEVPQVEADAATAAVNEAKASGADTYVSESYVALSDSLKSVMAEIEAENSKFFKKFGPQKEKLVKITQQAAVVKQASETRKAEIKTQVAALAEEVKALIETGRQLAAVAPKGKEGAAAVDAIKEELTVVETTIGEASAQAEKGELMPALDKVKAAKEKATSINTELQTVIDKYKGAKK
ncbi:hypothetical protein [uncultured Imperialibacter sp.]|mgnify:FL=1|uniref:DUF2291 family protein n=1 Tax=uncultured Imperialibacter sp. TaxID=1672639 RepID=UPI0030DB93A2|tara:strand:+ start:1627 stop:2229 length:603 start_codon:yes stop_codon:yes gene_type:complete